jgi:hypothetical protein
MIQRTVASMGAVATVAGLLLICGCGGLQSPKCGVSPKITSITPAAGAHPGSRINILGTDLGFGGTSEVIYYQGVTIVSRHNAVTDNDPPNEDNLSSVVPNIPPGTYLVSVADSDNCQGNTFTYTIL